MDSKRGEIIQSITKRQQDILDVLIDAKGFPLSTREIAERVGMDWKTANKHLEILYGIKRTIHKAEKRKIKLWYVTYRRRDPVEKNWK